MTDDLAGSGHLEVTSKNDADFDEPTGDENLDVSLFPRATPDNPSESEDFEVISIKQNRL